MDERPLLLWLASDRAADAGAELLGGKAASLARLIAAGEPVPRAAVLTTAAGTAFGRTATIRALAERLRGPDADEIDDDEIDRTFRDAPLPDRLARTMSELASGWQGPVAVRSSATAEDLTTAAFAGQYRTVLDVHPSELEHAVRSVWASLWHEAPRAYRRLRGIDDGSPAMAVLVMEMVEPDTAGVLFTRDPVGNETNVRLEVVEGSGEALVSGATTPDAHTWPRDEAALAAARLGPAYGELVERGLALEAGWGTPLDIEFAVDRSGRLWLLQARPVTTFARAGGSARTRAGIAEMLPGVLPPLLQATSGHHVDEGFRNLLAGLGADLTPTASMPLVRFDRSRALLDLSLLRHITSTIPGGSVSALEQGYGAGPSTGSPGGRTSVAQIARVMRRRRAAVVESEIVVQAVDRLVVDERPADARDLGDVLARWERVQDLGARTTSAEMAVAALATAAHEGVEHTLRRYVGTDRARELAQRLTARPRSPGGPLDRCLRAVEIEPVDARDPLRDHLRDHTRDHTPVHTGAAGRWDEALARSGSRSVFGGPTWAADPELARLSLDAARSAAVTSIGVDLLRSIEPPPGSRRPRMSRVRRRFLRREAADAAELLDRRERTKQALLDLGGIAHRLTLDVAAGLSARDVLASPDDVWFLTPTELRAACTAGVVPDDLPERRSSLAADQAADAVSIATTGDGRGWPASPGTAIGRAVVVDVPSAGAIRCGDVLVARTTDAAWAPLFALAAAIVVEEGGPLSHASIVARELGVPAVVNLPGIVEQVRSAPSGSVIRVDGTTGEVTILEEPPTLAPVIGLPEDEPRLGVFVTGLIGASALLGLVVSITEAVSSARGIRRTRARAAVPAAVLADLTRDGTATVERCAIGLLPARRYGQAALAMLVAGLALTVVAATRYVVGGSADRITWLVAGLSILPASVVSAVLARRAQTGWPDVPPVLRRLTSRGGRNLPSAQPRSPIDRAEHPLLRRWWREVPTPHRRWLVVFASIAIGLLVLNLAAPEALRTIDEPIYDAVGAPDPDHWGPDWFGMYFGRPQVVVPVALLVALFTVRCRVLAVAYPLTIMFGGLLNLGLGALVGKERPPLGPHAGQTDSFPSGHAIEVTLLLGLLPLAVAVLLRSNWAGRISRIAASAVLAVMLIDGLRDGSHWPTDHLGGFAIAMTAIVLVHALARMPSLHGSCRRCPAMALRTDPPAVAGGDSS